MSFAHSQGTTHATIQNQAFRNQITKNGVHPRYLKGSDLATESEDDTIDENEERVFSGLNKLKDVIRRKPDFGSTLAKNAGLAKALEKNTDPNLKNTETVRSFISRNPTMTRGLSVSRIDYMIAIVSLFVSIGALGVLIDSPTK